MNPFLVNILAGLVTGAGTGGVASGGDLMTVTGGGLFGVLAGAFAAYAQQRVPKPPKR